MRAHTFAQRWVGSAEYEVPEGITVLDMAVTVAASRRIGLTHTVARSAGISDGQQTYFPAVWTCGGSTIDAVASTDDVAVPRCLGCQLATTVPNCPVVYYAWSQTGELLYVGSSVRPINRIRAHMARTPWWHEVNRLTFTTHGSDLDARRAESEAIKETPGRYNREGTPSDRRFRQAASA